MTIEKWIESNEPLTFEMFDTFKSSTRGVSAKNQMLFLKKVMSEIQKGQIKLTVEELLEIKTFSFDAYVEFEKPKEIDYTLDLVLQTLQFVNNKGHFPKDYRENYELVRNIADFIADYLKNNLEYLSKINLLFDNCPERTAIIQKNQDDYYIELRGNNYKVYDIYQGYSIKNKDKSGNGVLIVHYQKGIYAKGIVCLLEVSERKPNKYSDDDLKYGKNIIYNDKEYPFNWKKNPDAFLITPDESPVESCEGRKSDVDCNLSAQNFWWCYGRKCMKSNQNNHSFEEWEKYTLRDFLTILNLPFEENGYYIFVSEINRLNRLLDRIKCKECDKILRPSKQSKFGFYRVSHFHCNENNCKNYQKEIYLTHCLNSKCSNVIDSRIAERCENGLIICDKCGSCCSNEQFTRRADSLRINGRSIRQSLISLIEDKKGHWEKAECFCYKCKSKMIEKGGNYKCEHCNIVYNRSNVYIRQNKNYNYTINQRSKIKPAE